MTTIAILRRRPDISDADILTMWEKHAFDMR